MAAKRATTSIPIVFFAVYAPVEIGLVPNLAHPGGNITGVGKMVGNHTVRPLFKRMPASEVERIRKMLTDP